MSTRLPRFLLCGVVLLLRGSGISLIASSWLSRFLLTGPFPLLLVVRNLACHNLCNNTTYIPPAVTKVLGLGLKFCLAERPPPKDLQASIMRLGEDAQRKYFFCDADDDDNEDRYEPKLYVKNEDWSPDEVSDEIDAAITKFGKSLQTAIDANKIHFRPNLLPRELKQLNSLRRDKDHVVLQTDKNLGTALWLRIPYIEQTLKEHLLDCTKYTRLAPDKAKAMESRTKEYIRELYDDYFEGFLAFEKTYVNRSFEKTDYKTPVYYGNPKVHKETLKTRPVVSCVHTVPQILSKHLDYWLNKVVKLCPSYIKDSWQLLDDLKGYVKQQGRLPPGARIFTADAVSMYTNIDTDHALDTIDKWLTLHKQELPKDFPPKNFILRGLEIVMQNNVFEFGDTYWHQKNGTAMGTSVACTYATIYYSYHEETAILNPQAGHNILFYRRLIDDAFIIQQAAPGRYARLNNALNSFGNQGKRLAWDPTPLATKDVVFLDLKISIQEDGQIRTKTHIKDMNLHLYIPAHSAHPPGLLKSLVHGQLYRFWRQNSDINDFEKVTRDFYRHLTDRGYDHETLKQSFTKAAERLDLKQRQPTAGTEGNDDKKGKQIFFHLQYHPDQISRRMIRECYDTHCAAVFKDAKHEEGLYPLNIRKFTIAYSRAPNIRDKLCRSKLPDYPGKNVSDIINKITENDN